MTNDTKVVVPLLSTWLQAGALPSLYLAKRISSISFSRTYTNNLIEKNAIFRCISVPSMKRKKAKGGQYDVSERYKIRGEAVLT